MLIKAYDFILTKLIAALKAANKTKLKEQEHLIKSADDLVKKAGEQRLEAEAVGAEAKALLNRANRLEEILK